VTGDKMADAERAFRAAFAALRAIGEGCPTPGEFARRGVRHLPQLCTSEITTLSLCDLVTGKRRVVSDPPHAFGRTELEAFDRHFREHPLVRFHTSHHDSGAHRISDSLGATAFRATPLYADYYARVGLDHALALPLYVDDRLLVSFVFNRKGRNFSDGERELLDLMRIPLATLYRQSYALAQARAALAASGDPSPPPLQDDNDALASLTDREREVLGWVAAGKSNAQIAEILGASPRTIAKHLERIYEKLGVESRTAAAMRAVRR
jgi:DNA-binding CsgD family transcriptional regulator